MSRPAEAMSGWLDGIERFGLDKGTMPLVDRIWPIRRFSAIESEGH